MYLIKTTTLFTKGDLDALQNGEIICLIVKNFVPAPARTLSLDFLKTAHSTFSRYTLDQTKAVGVNRSSLSFFETANNPEKLDKYYSEENFWYQHSYTDFMNKHNMPSPFESFVQTMQSTLSTFEGKTIPEHSNKPMLAFTVRSFETGFSLPTHIDEISQDSNLTKPYVHQFSMNMFLQAPTNSGLLQIWNTSLSPQQYKNQSYDGVHLNIERTPDFEIQPEAGDLFIFNSTLPHGVSMSNGGRSTISCFIGIDEEGNGKYWS
jgi:hypothetical protein